MYPSRSITDFGIRYSANENIAYQWIVNCLCVIRRNGHLISSSNLARFEIKIGKARMICIEWV